MNIKSYLYKCAKLSNISYSNIVDELDSLHKTIIFVENTSASFFVCKHMSSMYIVFKGFDKRY